MSKKYKPCSIDKDDKAISIFTENHTFVIWEILYVVIISK